MSAPFLEHFKQLQVEGAALHARLSEPAGGNVTFTSKKVLNAAIKPHQNPTKQTEIYRTSGAVDPW